MKLRWPLVLGASIGAFLLGTKVLSSDKPTADKKIALANLYTGSWQFNNHKDLVNHSLTIYPDLSIAIDGKTIVYQLIELTEDKLTIQDQLGYHLIIQTKHKIPVSLYDEADDATFPIIPLTKNETQKR